MQLLNALIFVLVGLLNSPQSADLTIHINGLRAVDGNIVIGLYNTTESFLKNGQIYRGASISATDNKLSYTFKNLPIGQYAVSVFHDQNKDMKCNRNWIGMPTEGYCFSNNYQPKFGPPNFEDAKFNLFSDSLITIKMIY